MADQRISRALPLRPGSGSLELAEIAKVFFKLNCYMKKGLREDSVAPRAL